MRYCLLFLLFLSSCESGNYSIKDLPSKNLIDSVITEAVLQDSMNIYKYSRSSKDRDDRKLHIYANLDTNLREYTLPIYPKEKGELEILQGNAFYYDYIKSYIIDKNINIQLFDKEDSVFFAYQIKNKKYYCVNLINIQEVSFTNDKQIEQIIHFPENNIFLKFNYFQLSKPIFNRTKDIAIVGVLDKWIHRPREVQICSSFKYYLVMKKTNDKWKLVTRI